MNWNVAFSHSELPSLLFFDSGREIQFVLGWGILCIQLSDVRIYLSLSNLSRPKTSRAALETMDLTDDTAFLQAVAPFAAYQIEQSREEKY